MQRLPSYCTAEGEAHASEYSTQSCLQVLPISAGDSVALLGCQDGAVRVMKNSNVLYEACALQFPTHPRTVAIIPRVLSLAFYVKHALSFDCAHCATSDTQLIPFASCNVLQAHKASWCCQLQMTHSVLQAL